MSTNNIKGATTFKSVVANVLLDDTDMGMYLKYLNYAIRIYKELNLFHLRTCTVVKLPMSDINTIEIPDDYMEFNFLAIPVYGRYWLFTRDDKLIIPATEECGEQVFNVEEGEGIVIGAGSDLYGYGLPGGRNDYYYSIDIPNNRIIINGFSRATVVLCYKGTGIKIGEETVIPKIAEEAIIAGVQMLIDRRDKKVPMNQKRYSEDLYDKEVEKLRLIQGPTLEELADVVYETYYQSIKR